MKCLSLWQPWASFVVDGVKAIETRNWPAPAEVIGQRVAIHASQNTAHGFPELPRGAVIGSVVIERCVPMTKLFIDGLEVTNPIEFGLGHYARGRFAFMLRDPEPLPEPVPVRGYQRFFHVDDAVIAGTIRS